MDVLPVILCWHEIFLKQKHSGYLLCSHWAPEYKSNLAGHQCENTFFQVLTPECRHSSCAQVQGLDLALGNLMVFGYLEYPVSERNFLYHFEPEQECFQRNLS